MTQQAPKKQRKYPTTQRNQDLPPKYPKPHMIVPSEDMAWALQQSPSVLKLWNQCWLADPYGSRWIQINTNLSDSAFRTARKTLSSAGLFIFKRETSINDARETVCWMVRNLHGARVKEFWHTEPVTEEEKAATQEEKAATQEEKAATQEEKAATNEQINATNKAIAATYKAAISPEMTASQPIREVSGTPQEHLRNSSKEFLRCDSESLSRSEEAAEFSPDGNVGQQLSSSPQEQKEPSQKFISPEAEKIAAYYLERVKKLKFDWDELTPEQQRQRVRDNIIEGVMERREFIGKKRIANELRDILDELSVDDMRRFYSSYEASLRARPHGHAVSMLNQALQGLSEQQIANSTWEEHDGFAARYR